MKILIVHCHPDPKSFNAAMTQRANGLLSAKGHDVTVTDLYAQKWMAASGRGNFQTVANADQYNQQAEEHHAALNNGFSPDIATEIEKLHSSDLLILQFPMWWGGMPAMMKGWIDRVFARGVAYDYGKFYEDGLLVGKKAMVSVTTGGGSSMYEADGINGDIHQILNPIHHNILHFCGFQVLPPFIAWQPGGVSEDDRSKILDTYEDHLKGVDAARPIAFPPIDSFDPITLRLRETAPARTA